jgi:hypothetical protein
MRWLGRSGNDDDDVEYDPTMDGLPHAFEQPPHDHLDEVAELLDEDVLIGSPLGFPETGHPLRPMHIEEAVVLIHDEVQSDFGRWGRRQEGRQQALVIEAEQRIAEINRQHEVLHDEVAQRKTELSQQQDQLSDPDLALPSRTRTLARDAAPVAVLAVVTMEVFALRPIVGQVIRLSNPQSWFLTTVAVSVIMASSYLSGAVLHRWLTYEGPRRIRHAHLVTAAILLVLGLGSLAGVVDIRMQMLSQGNTTWSAALLYIAMQGGVQVGAAVHGWWQHNPRVRQIRAIEQRIAELEQAGEDLTDRITELSDWEETLVQFQMTDWLTSRRAALADRYAATILQISRNTRRHELSRLGHHDAVNTVQMLPMPKFIPPVDSGSDDDDDWLSGPLLTL